MSVDPESVIRMAFAAVAAGDAAALSKLADPESLEERRKIALQTAEHGRRMLEEHPGSEASYRRLLAELHVDSAEEIERLPAEEMIRRSLRSLPRRRSELRCQVLGHVLESSDVAHVTFRIQWAGEPDPGARLSVATVRRSGGEWRFVVDTMSRWIVPGFDNMVVFDPEDATW